MVRSMEASGATREAIANAVSDARRGLGVKFKDLTPPDLLEKIYARNLANMAIN
jgi:hypothetical protein